MRQSRSAAMFKQPVFGKHKIHATRDAEVGLTIADQQRAAIGTLDAAGQGAFAVTASAAAAVVGIRERGLPGTAADMREPIGSDGKIDTQYIEFNSAVWAQDIGYTVTPPPGFVGKK